MNKNMKINIRISETESIIIKRLIERTGWTESEAVRFCINTTNAFLSNDTIDSIIRKAVKKVVK